MADPLDFLDDVDEAGQPTPVNPPTPAPDLQPVPVPVQKPIQPPPPAPEPTPTQPVAAPEQADPLSFLDEPAAPTDPLSFLDERPGLAAAGGAGVERGLLDEPIVSPPGDPLGFLDERPGKGTAFGTELQRGFANLYVAMTEDFPGVIAEEGTRDTLLERALGIDIPFVGPSPELKAINLAKSQERGKRAQAMRENIRANSPEPVIANVTEVHSMDDLGYWAVERFGEQVPNLLAFGLASAAGAGLAVTGKAIGAIKASPQVGAAIGGFLSSTFLETAFIASEQFEATGSFNPEVSIPAGAGAGMLEFLVPFKFLREVGKGDLLSVIKTPVRESITELGQEIIAVTAREITDPNYTFFSKETGIRLLESAAAGFVVGLPFGGASSVRAATRRKDEPAPSGPRPARPGPQEGPLSWLRTRKRNIVRRSGDVGPEGRTTPVEDPIETNYLDDEMNRQWEATDVKERRVEKLLDLEDDHLPRYVIMDAEGKAGNQVFTATSLEEELARRAPLAEKPRIRQLDMDSLQPISITADVFDLPPGGDPRIWFVPGVTEAEKAELEAQYLLTQAQINGQFSRGPDAVAAREASQAAYTQLLDRGLRVIPSRGQGFSYNGFAEAKGEELSEVPVTRRSVQVFTADSRPISGELTLRPLPGEALTQNLIQAGISPFEEPLAVDLDQLEPGSFTELPDGTLRLNKPAPESAITFGYPLLGDLGVTPLTGRITSGTAGEVTRINATDPLTVTTQTIARAQQAVKWIQEFKPFLEDLQRRLGMKNLVKYMVLEEFNTQFTLTGSTLSYQFNTNIVVYNAWNETSRAKEDTKEGFLLSVIHEIGHAVTINSWAKLDPRIKAKVYEGYKRALLRNRIRGDFEHVRLPFNATRQNEWTEPHKFYYLTFTEYLAEQFRRWATSKREALGADELFLAKVGKQLESLYKEYNDFVSPEAARSMFTPDYTFTTWMDLLLSMRDDPETPMRLARRLELTNEVRIPVDMASTYTQVIAAFEEFGFLAPEGVTLETALFEENETARTARPTRATFDLKSRVLRVFIGSLAKYKGLDANLAAKTVVHEMYHAVEDALTVEQTALLAGLSKREKIMNPQTQAGYLRDYKAHLRDLGHDPADFVELMDRWLDKEHIAFLIEERLRGTSFGVEADTIVDKILAFVQRVISIVTGNGWHTPEDVLKAFFRGEFTDKQNALQNAQAARRLDPETRKAQDSFVLGRATETFQGMQVAKRVDRKGGRAEYEFFFEEGGQIGYIELNEEKGVGWDVDMIRILPGKAEGKGFPQRFFDFVEQDLQTTLQASGTLTRAGHRMLSRINPEQIRFHVFDPRTQLWFSPNQIDSMLASALTNGNEVRKRELKVLQNKIPKEAFKDPELDKKFAREPARLGLSREYERSQEIDDHKLLQATVGIQTPPEDYLDSMNSELEGDSPPAPANIGLNNTLNWFKRGEKDPEIRRIIGQIQVGADKISLFSKMFFNILQIAQRNPHIAPLTRYVAKMEAFNAKRMFWVQKADETAKAWDALPEKQRNNVSDMSFWATEMRYLTPAERRQNVIRNPTPQELQAESQRIGMDIAGARVFARVQQNFQEYLQDLETTTIAGIVRRISDPTVRQAAVTEVRADMARLRQKPYFPFVRFGQFSITVRNQFSNNRVIHFSLYPTERERDAALKQQISRQFSGFDTTIGEVPENVHEFMGLPTTLLRQVRQGLPGITLQQREWMEQFETLMAPERSFRKRFLRRKGTPGYSLDGMRVFAHYFRSGANYLARVEFKEQLDEEVRDMETRGKTLKDAKRSNRILTFMRRHLDYVMTGGNDWATFKSMVAIWQLGVSPAAAAINLTQIPVVTWPYLTARYGNIAGSRELLRVMQAAKSTFGKPPPHLSADFLQAREEMIAQGKISVGQAAELGGFAEGPNLLKMLAGTKAQKWWRNIQWYSMWMFQSAEAFNRELTFAAAYNLALQQSNSNAWLQNFALEHNVEVNELMLRRNLTNAQAVATLAGREAIQETQFEYSPYARPAFLQNGPASAVLVFFQFLQNMLFQMGNSPGKVKMWFMMMTLYGVSGMPGSDDLDALIRLLSQRFGIDFSPKRFTREKIRELTRGTMFDQVGPDLVMHGLSRYSYGLGLIADGYGVPQFDASGSGSMGRIIPGLQEGLRTAANGGNWKDFTAEVARDISGAGFGLMFQWLQLMESDPFSGDGTWKKWEGTFPRGVKATSKAGRYAVQGGDIDPRTGAEFVSFSLQDPDDVSTLVAQALGFTSRKVTQKWEAIRAHQDVSAFYTARKGTLLLQLSHASRAEDPKIRKGAIEDVLKRVRSYNAELKDFGVPELGISGKTIQQSMRTRANVKARREAGLPRSNQEIRLQQRIFDTFPGVMVEQKKVK